MLLVAAGSDASALGALPLQQLCCTPPAPTPTFGVRMGAADAIGVPLQLPNSLLDIIVSTSTGRDILGLLASGQKQQTLGSDLVLLAASLVAQKDLEDALNAWVVSNADGILSILNIPCSSTVFISEAKYTCGKGEMRLLCTGGETACST